VGDERQAVVVACCRTPLGKRGGVLAGWHPVDLLGVVLVEVLQRGHVDPERVDDVIGGCVTQVGEQSTNVTRNAWVAAGLPPAVPASTVDRQCGSSQQAVHFAAAGVVAGHYDVAVACGVESMSRVPLASNAAGGTGPFPPSFLQAIDGRLWTQFRVAQVLADRYGISRQAMDEYAAESHRRAAAATAEGRFAAEIVPVAGREPDGTPTDHMVTCDEGIRPETTVERLATLAPAQRFEPETARDITAGNSSQMTDGAAAVVVAERRVAERAGWPVLARIVHATVGADDPAIMLSAPVPVTERLLERTGMSVGDFDAIECNEAFAAIALMWSSVFRPDAERFNPVGGAIALGHPLGASGARLLTTLVHRLQDIGGRYGFQTMCEGGGQANATVVERLG
jgi:acetyl-CoA acyltransferase